MQVKASMCTKPEVDWTMVDSDHAGVQIWLDICKKAPRGPGLFKVNGSLLEDPVKLTQAKAQIDTKMQQLDPTWNPHKQLEFSKLCVRTTLSQIGQITPGTPVFAHYTFCLMDIKKDNGDPNTGHSKTCNIKKPDILTSSF